MKHFDVVDDDDELYSMSSRAKIIFRAIQK
jgi:hypothetical protein